MFLREAPHLGHQSAGGDGHVPLADVQAVFIGEKPDKAEQILIIVQRLPGSHHHHVGNTLSGDAGDGIYLIQHL